MTGQHVNWFNFHYKYSTSYGLGRRFELWSSLLWLNEDWFSPYHSHLLHLLLVLRLSYDLVRVMIQFGRKLGWYNCYHMSMFSLKAINTHIHVKSRPTIWRSPDALQWRHNERDDISNHKPHDCLLSRLSSMHCPAKERKWFRLADQEVHSLLVIAIHEIFVSFPPACNQSVMNPVLRPFKQINLITTTLLWSLSIFYSYWNWCCWWTTVRNIRMGVSIGRMIYSGK